MKTRGEVEALKANWLEDPCYDLEEVEGFEDYRVELLAFRRVTEARLAQGGRDRRSRRVRELECSMKLVEYIEKLEARLEKLEARLEKLEARLEGDGLVHK